MQHALYFKVHREAGPHTPALSRGVRSGEDKGALQVPRKMHSTAQCPQEEVSSKLTGEAGRQHPLPGHYWPALCWASLMIPQSLLRPQTPKQVSCCFPSMEAKAPIKHLATGSLLT